MNKFLWVLPIMMPAIAFLVLAFPSDFSHVHSLKEERIYDRFGIVNHFQNGSIELSPSSNFNIIRTELIASVKNNCELKLNTNVPDVFNPEINIIRSNVPITSDFVLVTNDLSEETKIEIETEIKLNEKSIDVIEVGDLTYEPELKKFLQSNDEIFHYPLDDPEIRKIADSIDKNKNTLEMLDDIKCHVNKLLKYSDGEEADFLKNLKLGTGDCDDFSRLFVSLCRAVGIPSKVAFNSNHMWSEVCVPLKNGGCRWIIADPTDSYDLVSYTLSLDIESECENHIIEEEVWSYS